MTCETHKWVLELAEDADEKTVNVQLICTECAAMAEGLAVLVEDQP